MGKIVAAQGDASASGTGRLRWMHEAPGDQLAWEASFARIETARAKCDDLELQRESLCNRIAALLCQPACEKPVDHVAQQLIEQVQQISRAELNEIRTLLRPPAPARKCLEALWM